MHFDTLIWTPVGASAKRVSILRAHRRFIGPNRHQPNEKPIKFRRGEGGEEWRGGPSWAPASRSPRPIGCGRGPAPPPPACIKSLSKYPRSFFPLPPPHPPSPPD